MQSVFLSTMHAKDSHQVIYNSNGRVSKLIHKGMASKM